MALSYTQWQGDGVTQSFPISFQYIAKEHVSAVVNLDPVAFTWDDDNTIRISPAPANGAIVEARRTTPRAERLVDFSDGSTLTESDLDLAQIQTFYIVQEAIDIAGGTLELLSDGSYGAGGRRIKNLGTAIEPRDAITKEYHDGTFLPQLNALLSQALAARDVTVSARDAAIAARDAAVAARDLARGYRDETWGYREDVIARQADVTAKHSNVVSKSANVDTKAATVDTQSAQVAADRSATQGFRNEAEGFKNAASASADRAATFDPSSYYTKVQVYTKTETYSVAQVDQAVANGISNRVAKTGDTMTGPFEISYANPSLWLHHPGVKKARLVVDGSGTLLWQDQGGQNHFYVTAGGAVWTQQLGDLNSRIEARAEAWSAARRDEANSYAAGLHNAQQGDVNERVHRIQFAGRSEWDNQTRVAEFPTVLCDAWWNGGTVVRRAATLQMHIPAQGGWVNVWA